MERDEILKAAQDNPQEQGEYEKHISNKAVLYGLMVGIVLLMAMMILEWIIKKKIDLGKPALLFGISSVMDFYDGFVGKKKMSFVGGIITGLLAVVFFVGYIGVLFV